jgi:hypothetical protein
MHDAVVGEATVGALGLDGGSVALAPSKMSSGTAVQSSRSAQLTGVSCNGTCVQMVQVGGHRAGPPSHRCGPHQVSDPLYRLRTGLLIPRAPFHSASHGRPVAVEKRVSAPHRFVAELVYDAARASGVRRQADSDGARASHSSPQWSMSLWAVTSTWKGSWPAALTARLTGAFGSDPNLAEHGRWSRARSLRGASLVRTLAAHALRPLKQIAAALMQHHRPTPGIEAAAQGGHHVAAPASRGLSVPNVCPSSTTQTGLWA